MRVGGAMKLYTYKTAADALDCSSSTVQKLVRDGEIPILNIGNEVRIDADDLQAFIDRKKYFKDAKNRRDPNDRQPLPTPGVKNAIH
jgi:excisionase family DNA binding protein